MKIRGAILALLLVGGCAGMPTTPRGAFMGAAATMEALYISSGQLYAVCDANAGDDAERQRCFDEKNARGLAIRDAKPYLDAYAHAVIAADAAAAAESATLARQILAGLHAALAPFTVTDEQARALEWLEAP